MGDFGARGPLSNIEYAHARHSDHIGRCVGIFCFYQIKEDPAGARSGADALP